MGRVAALAFALAWVPARLAHGQAAAPAALSLGDAARLAARQSTQAAVASAAADEGAARAMQKRAALLPEVTTEYADGRRTFNTASFGLNFPGFDPHGEVIGPVRTVDVRARLRARLYDPHALAEYRSAQAKTDVLEAEAASAAERAAVVAAGAYLRSVRAQAQLGAHAADSALARELLGIARQQVAAGLGVALDVTRAEARVAATRSLLISARRERDLALNDLRRAINVAADEPLTLTDSLDPLPDSQAFDEAALVAAAERRRADVRSARASAASASQARAAARAVSLPVVGAFVDEGLTSRRYDALLGTYTFGVQVAIPVFDGFRTRASVQEQDAVLRGAELRERDLRRQVASEVHAARIDLDAAREQVAIARERLRLAGQELEQARERFRVGVTGNADVITAQLALEGARIQLIDAQAGQQAARVALARASGTITELP